MKDIKELRALTTETLQVELLDLRKQHLNLRLQKASGALNKTHLVTQVRKAIARVKTILSEKMGEGHAK